MGKKKKISPSVKIKQVEFYLEGKTSLHQIARKYGVAHSTVEIWVVKYKAEGRSGFYQEKRCIFKGAQRTSCPRVSWRRSFSQDHLHKICNLIADCPQKLDKGI